MITIQNEKNGKYQHLVTYCIDMYSEFENSSYREKKIEDAKKARLTYEQRNEQTEFPWKDASNIILPLTTITVDNLEPRLVAGLTGKQPFVQLDAEGLTEQPPEYEVLQEWFNDELKKNVKIDKVSKQIVHDILLDGTVFPVAEYKINEKTIREFQFDQQGNIAINPETNEPIIQDIQKKEDEAVKIKTVPLTDMFFADDIGNWEEADFIRIIRPSYAELQRVKNDIGYQNIDADLLAEEIDEALLEDDNLTPQQSTEDIAISGKKVIECLECHISYMYREEGAQESEIDDFTEERIIATIAIESQTLIRLVLLRDINMSNNHIIKRLRIYPEEGKTLGTSIYEKLKSIQEGASDTFNLVINSSTVTMVPWFLYGDRAGLAKDVEIYPGKGVPCDDPSQVQFPRFATNPAQHVEFINMFMSLWERLGSIGDLQVGRQSEKDRTATETIAVIEEGNLKHNYQSKGLREDFLDLVRTIWDLYYKNMPFDFQFQHHGQPVQLPRAIMGRGVKFTLMGSTDMANKLIERKENEALYQQLRPDPVINPLEIVKDLIKNYKPDTDLSRYINPDISQMIAGMQEHPELSEIIAQYLQDKQNMEGEGGQTA
jgi:hypothetical protein